MQPYNLTLIIGKGTPDDNPVGRFLLCVSAILEKMSDTFKVSDIWKYAVLASQPFDGLEHLEG